MKTSKSKTEIEAEKLERLARWPTVESERDYHDRVDEESFDIIARMEAMQQRFGRLQLCDTPPESDRQILRCAPQFDAQAEHESDLRYESRVDAESWQYDGPEEREDV